LRELIGKISAGCSYLQRNFVRRVSSKILTNMADTAYCVKCREKRDMRDGKEVSMPGKGGERRALTGFCVKCGTKMFKILGKK